MSSRLSLAPSRKRPDLLPYRRRRRVVVGSRRRYAVRPHDLREDGLQRVFLLGAAAAELDLGVQEVGAARGAQLELPALGRLRLLRGRRAGDGDALCTKQALECRRAQERLHLVTQFEALAAENVDVEIFGVAQAAEPCAQVDAALDDIEGPVHLRFQHPQETRDGRPRRPGWERRIPSWQDITYCFHKRQTWGISIRG